MSQGIAPSIFYSPIILVVSMVEQCNYIILLKKKKKKTFHKQIRLALLSISKGYDMIIYGKLLNNL